MRFDEFWEQDAAPKAADNSNVALLEAGTHVMEIKVVKESTVAWKRSDKNPEGKCLTLCLEKAGFKAIWTDIPVVMEGMIVAVCKSARIDPPSRGQEWDEQELKGKFVTVEVTINERDDGKRFVNVQRWKPNAEPLPAEVRKAPKRAASKAAAAHRETSDDIPF